MNVALELVQSSFHINVELVGHIMTYLWYDESNPGNLSKTP